VVRQGPEPAPTPAQSGLDDTPGPAAEHPTAIVALHGDLNTLDVPNSQCPLCVVFPAWAAAVPFPPSRSFKNEIVLAQLHPSPFERILPDTILLPACRPALRCP